MTQPVGEHASSGAPNGSQRLGGLSGPRGALFVGRHDEKPRDGNEPSQGWLRPQGLERCQALKTVRVRSALREAKFPSDNKRLVLAAVLASLCVTPIARAHLGHVVLRAERYLKLDAEPGGVRVVVSLTLGGEETARVMAAADADSDGTVTSAEADAYMAEWGAGLVEDVPLEVDGAAFVPEWGEAYFDPIGPIQSVPGAVEMVAHIPLDGGEHTVTMRDRMRVEAFDRTDVAFTAQPTCEVLASGPNETPTEIVERFAYGRESVPDALTAQFLLPGMTDTQRVLAYAGGGLAVVLAGLAWWAVARRRR